MQERRNQTEDDKVMRCEPGGDGSWRQELRPLRGAGGGLWPQGPRSWCWGGHSAQSERVTAWPLSCFQPQRSTCASHCLNFPESQSVKDPSLVPSRAEEEWKWLAQWRVRPLWSKPMYVSILLFQHFPNFSFLPPHPAPQYTEPLLLSFRVGE